jgi:hypothetical protein
MNNNIQHKTRFSITGSGYYFKMFDEQHPLFLKLSEIDPTKHHLMLFMIDHFKKMKLVNDAGNFYESYADIIPTHQWVAYDLEGFTRLEIRREKSKSMKISFNEFRKDALLFPRAYQTQQITFKESPLLIIENDKGNFGTSSMPRYFENEEQLTFRLVEVPQLNKTLVEAVMFEGDQLVFRKPDTLNFSAQVHSSAPTL